jgi:hypothetical protein
MGRLKVETRKPRAGDALSDPKIDIMLKMYQGDIGILYDISYCKWENGKGYINTTLAEKLILSKYVERVEGNLNLYKLSLLGKEKLNRQPKKLINQLKNQ